MHGIIFRLPFKSCGVIALTSVEFNLNPQQLPIQCTAVRAVPRFVLGVAPSNAELIHLILNSHTLLRHHMPFAGGAFHKNSELSRRGVAVCDVADQPRTEREQLIVEEWPGRSSTLHGNSGHGSQLSDLTQLSCNHCSPSFIYTEFVEIIVEEQLKTVALFQLRCHYGCMSGGSFSKPVCKGGYILV